MADKTFTNMANPLFFGMPVVNGLFKWTDVAAAVKNSAVRLKADGPPIEVGAITGVNQTSIGVVLEGGEKTNDIVVILSKFTAIIAIAAGATVVRGDHVKTDAAGLIIVAVTADVGTAATGSTVGRVLGMVLQSGVVTDILYVGIGG